LSNLVGLSPREIVLVQVERHVQSVPLEAILAFPKQLQFSHFARLPVLDILHRVALTASSVRTPNEPHEVAHLA
jgi:hypothetical protein